MIGSTTPELAVLAQRVLSAKPSATKEMTRLDSGRLRLDLRVCTGWQGESSPLLRRAWRSARAAPKLQAREWWNQSFSSTYSKFVCGISRRQSREHILLLYGASPRPLEVLGSACGGGGLPSAGKRLRWMIVPLLTAPSNRCSGQAVLSCPVTYQVWRCTPRLPMFAPPFPGYMRCERRVEESTDKDSRTHVARTVLFIC